MGVDRREEPGLLRHALCHRTGRAEHREHHARKDDDAVADHGVITGDTVTGKAAEAQGVFDKLEAVGIDLPDVFRLLEDEGVEKFEKSWQELIDATQEQLDDKK